LIEAFIMKIAFRIALLATLFQAGVLSAQIVDHDKIRCEQVAREETKSQMDLQRKLNSEGWKVRQIKNFNGCYEVYGFDEKGERVEAFFHPGTFAKVGVIKQPS